MCCYADDSDNMIMSCQGFICSILYSSPCDSFNLVEWICNCMFLLHRDPTFNNQKLKTLSNIQKSGGGVEDKSFNLLCIKKTSDLLILLQRGNSDKNYDIQIRKWNNNKNTTQTHFTYWLFLTSVPPPQSQSGPLSTHLAFLFLPVSGWLMDAQLL
jgi:hypothetical protein